MTHDNEFGGIFSADISGLKAILNLVHDAAALICLKGNFEYVNPAFTNLFGYKSRDVLERNINILELSDQLDSECLSKEFKQIIEGGFNNIVYKKRAKNGEIKNVLISGKALNSDSNDKSKYIISYHDLTKYLSLKEKNKNSYIRLIEILNLAMKARDPYTAHHEENVANIAVKIGEKLGLSAEQNRGLYLGGLVHDLGKLKIPAEILSKPAKLSKQEFELIKCHPVDGFNLVESVDFEWPIKEMILQHHERLDGSGYPNRLSNEQIIIEARIMAVADVLEAMCSHRPYRSALGVEKAIDELRSGAGKKYDLNVVNALLELIEQDEIDLGLPRSRSL